jgi:hypothetical protein
MVGRAGGIPAMKLSPLLGMGAGGQGFNYGLGRVSVHRFELLGTQIFEEKRCYSQNILF